MKYRRYSVIVCVILLLFLPFRVCAQDSLTGQILADGKAQMEVSEGIAETQNFYETTEKIANGEFEWSFSGILNYLGNLLFDEIQENFTSLMKMIVVAVMAGILCNIEGNFAKNSITNLGFLTCFMMIAGLSAGVFRDVVALARETIDTLHIFTQGLIPTVASIAVSGGSGAAASISPLLFVCMQTITYLAKNFFLPFHLVVCALSIINNVTERFHIGRLIEFARQILKWSTGILLTVYIGLLGFQGFSVGYLNGVAGKTVKYAVCNFIPLVGSALAESVEAVCASAALVKNSVGVAGILSLISICLLPLCKLLALSALYRFAAGVAEPVTDKRITNLLGETAANITQTFVILLMLSVMFIISIGLLCSFTNLPMN
ncbi:MAG: stage III sporulation protein AE [Clostridia bacterium]|nr:stage III sporulation protein AE [Clostridia bacterium]